MTWHNAEGKPWRKQMLRGGSAGPMRPPLRRRAQSPRTRETLRYTRQAALPEEQRPSMRPVLRVMSKNLVSRVRRSSHLPLLHPSPPKSLYYRIWPPEAPAGAGGRELSGVGAHSWGGSLLAGSSRVDTVLYQRLSLGALLTTPQPATLYA